MNEDLKRQVSEFLDNELDHAAAFDLLQKMHNDQALTDTLNRYALIGEALKSGACLPVANDFTANLSARIAQEPYYLMPKRKPAKRHHQAFALAASIAAIAVITSQSLDKQTPQSSASAVQLAQQAPVKKTGPRVDDTKQAEQYPLNARINDYLQAHNNSVYTNGQADFRPLAKVTAYNSQK